MKINYRLHIDENTVQEITSDQLDEFASMYGLDRLIPGRYSSQFIFDLFFHEQTSGVDPDQVLDEIRHLEGMRPSRQTKPATEFTGPHLKGLWHKHFMPALPSVIGHNIVNSLGKNGLAKIVDEAINANGADDRKALISKIAHQVVIGSMEDRAAADKLTGEWIIFAKDNGQNYYLHICTHESGDENIANTLKSTCAKEFPFLSTYLS